jgi:hypothetical protein
VIYSIGPSPIDANVIWTGSDDGAVHVTRDGGAHWSDVTPNELTPWSKVTQIDASRFDVNTAYVSVSRFRLDDLTPLVFRTHDGGKTWTMIARGLANASVNVVREDPKTQGLLFAGTERDVYVSFDDGGNWQSLTLNLPHTSVRDLIVKGDDLAIATHGRGFWILDNMTPLRVLASQRTTEGFLYKPAVAYRLRRNQNTDTPLPPEIPAGKNPPTGAIIDYYLAADAGGPVTLEIYAGPSSGARLVRRFSSDDKPDVINEKDVNVPMYWARPPQTLSTSKGMHRFVWDLRYPPPDAVEHDFPISAIYRDTPREPLGVFALPGVYSVKLTVNGRTETQPLTITMDPRASVAAIGLQQQFTLATRIVGAMNKSFAALQSAARDSDRARELSALNADLASALDVVEGADRAPTVQASRSVAALERRLATLIQ